MSSSPRSFLRSTGLYGLLTLLFLAALSLTFLGMLHPTARAQPHRTSDPVEVLSTEDTTCYFLTWQDGWVDPVHHIYKTVDIAVSIPYTGVIEEATLLLRSANVRANTHHPILINGVDTGYAPPADDYPSCDPPRPAIQEYPLDLTQVPIRPGLNIIRLTAADSTDNWGADYVAIRVRGHDLKGGHFVDITFPGENGDMVEASILEPYNWQPNSPLLLLFHGWRGQPIDPFFTDYTPAALEYGWIGVSPRQRGKNALGPGGQPLASLISQHDAIKLIDYMKTHYQIDPDRIYVGGFSMGGMMAGMMAAKYPDTFAAAVTHMAITDLRDWYYEVSDYRQTQIITETGGPPESIPFEYDRRSPKEMASNLKNVPVAIIHGDADTVVPPHHAQDFYDAVMAANPVQAELHWYHGDHDPAQTPPYGGTWAVAFMKDHRRVANPTSLRIRTDESKSFYWMTITAHKTEPWHTFTQVDVDRFPEDERVHVRVQDNARVDLGFDLQAMGLDPRASYVVSMTNDISGSNVVAHTPISGQLYVSAPEGTTQIDIFPNRGNLPVELILQRGKDNYDGVQDAWINQWSMNQNYGSASILYLRPGAAQRALIRFDLQNMLPPDVEITSADLYLYDEGSGPSMTVDLYALQTAWEEASVTYNQASAGHPWNHPGGDFDASSPVGSVVLNGSQPGYVRIDVLNAVRDWLRDSTGNHGLLLDVTQAEYGGVRRLRASEWWDIGQRPYLKLVYQTQSVTPTPAPGSVSGVVYEDRNRNRQFDAGEPPLAGARIQLLQNGRVLQSQTTGVDGRYHLTGLGPGSYQLQESPPPAYWPARPASVLFFALAAGQQVTFDFAHDPRLYLPAVVH